MAYVEQIDPGMTNVAPRGAKGDQTGVGTPQGQFTWNRVANGDAHTVKDAQEYLAAHGYHPGGVDGIWGPHTARALRNYLNAVHPKAHQAQVRAVMSKHPQTGKFQPAPRAPAPKPIKGGGGSGGKGGGGKGGRGRGRGGGGGGAAPPPGLMNPQKQAQSMANAEFDPAIGSLKQALLDLATQGKYDQGQVKGMYGQMSDLMNRQNAEQGSNQAAELQNITGDMGNVAQLFGASDAQAMQPALGNATGLIGAEGKSEQDYLSNMLPLLKAQAAQGNQNIDQLTMAQQRNYNDQLTRQQQAKGQAYNADYQQALSDQATQQQNQMALAQAQAMFPAQLGAARASAKAARVNAKYAGQYNRAKIQAEQASAAHSNALSAEAQSVIQKNLAYARKAQIEAKGSKNNKVNVLEPGSTSFNRIQDNLYHAMQMGSGKGPITNPVRAQHALFNQAVAAGLIDKQGRPLVKGAIQLLNSTLGAMYNKDANWQNGWQWTGNRFVQRKS